MPRRFLERYRILTTAWLAGKPEAMVVAMVIAGLVAIGVLLFRDYRFIVASEAATAEKPIHQPVSPSRPAPDGAMVEGLLGLFGDKADEKTADPAPIPETQLDLTLKGTFTHHIPAQSSSLISDNGQPARRLFPGENIAPGTKLVEVRSGQVVLLRNGRKEVLSLPLLSGKGEQFHRPPVSARAAGNKTHGARDNRGPRTEQRRAGLQERLSELRSGKQYE